MDMGKSGTVSQNKKSYRYVLSVMGVFSRFVWLCAVREKSNKVISDELQNIYLEHGPQRAVQSDQGSEVKGAVTMRARPHEHRANIYSPPFHPQSQGRVERSLRSLRSKIEYDFLKMGRKGVNCTENLSNYQRILNEDPKKYYDTRHPLRSTSLEEAIRLIGHRPQEWKKNCLRIRESLTLAMQIESADKTRISCEKGRPHRYSKV